MARQGPSTSPRTSAVLPGLVTVVERTHFTGRPTPTAPLAADEGLPQVGREDKRGSIRVRGVTHRRRTGQVAGNVGAHPASEGLRRFGSGLCDHAHVAAPDAESYKVSSLFSGIGGLELGFAAAGHTTNLLCEIWDPARAVLSRHFPGIRLEDDVRTLPALPGDTDVVTAGFPCTDLSQAGRTAGIRGEQSGLVVHVFRLLDQHHPRWLVLENVRNMLPLDGGLAMRYLVSELERRKYNWAYRVVDSRFAGVPQRRQRVLLVASATDDPRGVLLSDDAGEPGTEHFADDVFGFYWTEGLRGLGWAQDATPTLKGGSTIGIPSPPGIWIPDAPIGKRLVTPSLGDAEALQGFARGWTSAAADLRGRKGPRWKLVGNAVTVGVAEWLGRQLASPGSYDDSDAVRLEDGQRWPSAAWGGRSYGRWSSQLSMWPELRPYMHLRALLQQDDLTPLSYRAAAGFFERTQRAKLRFDPDFILDVKRHVEAVAPPSELTH
jgi:DNA (cytosine-5)-methyltransferase 1